MLSDLITQNKFTDRWKCSD